METRVLGWRIWWRRRRRWYRLGTRKSDFGSELTLDHSIRENASGRGCCDKKTTGDPGALHSH